MSIAIPATRSFAVDTTFVLFFLAIEFGQSLMSFGLDGVFLAVTLMMLLILPYYLQDAEDRPDLGRWLVGRIFIAAFAAGLGVIFRQSVGVVIPDAFKFLPMTLLIVTAMFSCFFQFYAFTKFRLAK
jgi:hypothetical protein